MSYKAKMNQLDSLYTYWPLDEYHTGGGSVMYDMQGRYGGDIYGATLHGGTALIEDHISGSYVFDGVNDYVQVGNAMHFENRLPYTMSMWVFASDNGIPYPTFLSKAQYGVGGYEFYITRSSMKWSWARINSGGGATYHYSNASVSWNTWTHVTMRYDGTYMKFYINGQPDASLYNVSNCGVSSTPFRLGGYAGGGEHFYGHLDEVMVFTSALSDATIQYIFENSFLGHGPRFFAHFI